ncbi:hypothetical protein K435DRAFT_867883 [Dendrothele bispora CBS 962.96]|uniref:Chromatin elongation factor spt5 n=1 Tax=Dendrothele bispora (strain CBS 962.96) TaxID=1314807 RepID=A0A4S8LD53_DENBC|nr:hypothetical protein K435DRAFT_867883 [Dendrothele bispora CBS 962.96]
MSNPFVDLEAYEDREEDEYGPDVEDGDHGDEEDIYDDQGQWDVEDHPVHEEETAMDTNAEPAPGFLDTLTEHLANRYVKQPISLDSTSCEQSEDEFMQKLIAKADLLAEEKQLFWRVKCKPGREFNLVLDIMHHELRQNSALVSTTHDIVHPVPTGQTTTAQQESSSPAAISPSARALRMIRQYALTQVGEPKELSDSLQSLLGCDFTVEWSHLIDRAGLEPGEEDVLGALAAVNTLAAQSLPAAVVLEADHTQDLSPVVRVGSQSKQSHNFGVEVAQRVVPPARTLLSAFCIPTVNGSVYLEGSYDDALVRFLWHHSGVIKHKTSSAHLTPWIEPVPSADVSILLEMPLPSIQPLSWVRITRGQYRDVVGLVQHREMCGSQRRLIVLLVPRLTPAADTLQNSLPPSAQSGTLRKRKREKERASQRLFVQQSYSGPSTRIGPSKFRAGQTEYHYGLVVKCYDYSSVTQNEVVMDEATRKLFRVSGHPLLERVHLPLPDDWVFYVEDQVEIVVPAPLSEAQRMNPDLPRTTYRKDGTVIAVAEKDCSVRLAEHDAYAVDNSDMFVTVPKINIRKKIRTGHSVVVEAGQLKGRDGLVLTNFGDMLEVHEMRRTQLQAFHVHANSCRVTTLRSAADVPWLDRHITVVDGPYRGYTGLITDTHPPSSHPPHAHFTTLDVRIPRSQLYLREAAPLTAAQQRFKQSTWDVYSAPNFSPSPTDPFTGRQLLADDLVKREPKEPWINVPVRVVAGPVKNTGIVRRIERNYKNESGLRLLVEFDYVSADHGASPQFWLDYAAVRDPRTGLPLHIVHTLKGSQRFWEPLIPIKAVSVPCLVRSGLESNQALQLPSTPTWNRDDCYDVFTIDSDSPRASSAAEHPPSHWTLDSRLDGKEFCARWEPKQESIYINDGGSLWWVPANEIFDLALPIRPTTNKLPLLVVRGPHTGKYLRQIFCKFIENEDEPVITGAVYDRWGTSAEQQVEPYLEVKAEDCAFAASDPNKTRFKEEIDTLRKAARKSDKGKTPKRPYKPRPRSNR